MKDSLVKLKTFDPETKDLTVVIETPKGSRNKFDYDEDLGVFKLAYVLPEGSTFPNEFGFIPSTLGEDGDPIDVMVLLDQPIRGRMRADRASHRRHRGAADL